MKYACNDLERFRCIITLADLLYERDHFEEAIKHYEIALKYANTDEMTYLCNTSIGKSYYIIVYKISFYNILG